MTAMSVSECKTPWGRALALSFCVVSASQFSLQVEASSGDAIPSFSGACSDLVSQDAPENVEQWLERSIYASHCYTFQARAVSIDTLGVRTLALSHRIHEGVRQQVVQHLDGPSVSVERRSQAGQLAWFESSADSSPSSPDKWISHVARFYDIALEDEARVAGRPAVQLSFVPHDEQRYHHEWWIDKETGLLLKHVLSDPQDRVLETFQMTQLQSPEPYGGKISAEIPYSLPEPEWQVAWLPDGFIDQPVESSDGGVEQRFFSDGLASVSIFATPVVHTSLEPGLHQIGISSAAIEFVTVGDQRWQLIGIGELPSSQLLRIVQSVEFK